MQEITRMCLYDCSGISADAEEENFPRREKCESIYASPLPANDIRLTALQDLFEDIIFLRITFLVVSDMASRSSIVSRELYSQDLSLMATLSIQHPGMDNMQIERLSRTGEDVAIQYDQVSLHP